jgi:nitrate/nitrite transport system ATP-binding protein
MAFLEVARVGKTFGRGDEHAVVLRDINLKIDQGEFVAIVGYSGSGKTTLLSILAGLLSPNEGSVQLDGRRVEGPGPDRGVVFQNYSLLPWMTVYENVALAVDQVFAHWPEEKRKTLIEHHIAMVNLTASRDKRPGQLSGGMRQRVSVARAFAMNPAVLLLDEPFGALDALTRATLQEELQQICQREHKTVVLITNDVDEALLLADRVIPLSAGPAATLGPEVAVGIERPRHRKEMSHDPRFKERKSRIIEYLLGPGSPRARRGAPPLPEGTGAKRVAEVTA